MLKEKDLSSDGVCGEETSQTNHISDKNLDNPDEKTKFPGKGIDFLRESEMACDGFQSKPSKIGNSGSQELTLSYLCDNSKLGFPEKEIPGKNLLNSFEKLSYKGKEVVSDDQNQEDDNRWVERDFLQLNEVKGNSSKREFEEDEIERENREKKPKPETLNLSLALPDVSLSLAASNPISNTDLPTRLNPSRSVQSLAPSNNTQTTYSNDFMAASLSYSYSHPFSHNPSCSLTRNSTENCEYSMGSHRRDCDQIWNGGEGTNGSVHSRFRPVGDGVALSNHGGSAFSLMQANRGINKESCNSLYRTTSSDNLSFFPSELPARPSMGAQSGDSRGRGSDHVRTMENFDEGRAHRMSRSEKIVREIVSESIPVMSQIIQELSDETVESTKEYLRNLISTPEKKEELVSLQKWLERRSDLSKEKLLKSHRNQLEILVSVKMGLVDFVSGKTRIPTSELVEIFVLERCRNVNCKRVLPVEDCDCKICSTKKGFCSECMCPVCLNFDCANNTCSWVGCDVCSHWCHATCGIQKNLIKPGPSLKGPSGTTNIQFHCLGCGHASEMFGFVKDVFMSCANAWAPETLMKELDCVRKIFRGSEDFKGKELHTKAGEMISKLESKLMSPSDVFNFLCQFFNYMDGMPSFPSSSVPPKELPGTQGSIRKDAAPLPSPNSLPPKPSFYDTSSGNERVNLLPHDLHQSDLNTILMGDKTIKDEWSVKQPKKDGFESLESLVRIKDVEARMFQTRADDAKREADSYRRMVRMKREKLDEEYTEKFAKLSVQETEERRRKKLEELHILEHSHCDYQKMKMRMQAEIAGLLERMEATKQKWV
ncbi:Protein OBERON like [Actinidia chinensis var. chinensis]|uniref:Protein OBERON like n=1 Tax=Actinidia chinensis var. chinensis TaxID=1590841 RepID=A0A2R6QQI0_ACTCC|nr:Protein OBERON like [Actinidia chinensis var. chinensis]